MPHYCVAFGCKTNRDTAYIVSIDFQRTEEDGEDWKLPYEEVLDGRQLIIVGYVELIL